MQKKKLLAIIIVLAIPLVAAYGIFRAYKEAEKTQIQNIKDELEKLPKFSPIEAAAEKNWKYPPIPPKKTIEELNNIIKDEIDKQEKILFPKKELMYEKANVIKKYTPAKEGQYVEFQLNYSNDKVKGIFRGREGISIKIDDRKIKIIDVLEDYRYLFDEPMAEKLASEKCAELDKIWQEKIDNFKKEKEKELIEKYYTEEGFVKISEGLWKHHSDIVNEYIEKKEREFNEKNKAAKLEIFAKHKIFGIFPVSPEKIH